MELPGFWRNIWNPLIATARQILPAHICRSETIWLMFGRLSGITAQEFLNDHRQPFEEALLSLGVLANYRLFAVGEAGHHWLLRGKPQNRFCLALPVCVGLGRIVSIWFEMNSLQLFPLHLYDDVDRPFILSGGDAERRPASMLYLQYDASHRTVEYTALDPDVSFAQRDRVVEPFLAMFDLDRWSKSRKNAKTAKTSKASWMPSSSVTVTTFMI